MPVTCGVFPFCLEVVGCVRCDISKLCALALSHGASDAAVGWRSPLSPLRRPALAVLELRSAHCRHFAMEALMRQAAVPLLLQQQARGFASRAAGGRWPHVARDSAFVCGLRCITTPISPAQPGFGRDSWPSRSRVLWFAHNYNPERHKQVHKLLALHASPSRRSSTVPRRRRLPPPELSWLRSPECLQASGATAGSPTSLRHLATPSWA